jgi:hypothetical protein
VVAVAQVLRDGGVRIEFTKTGLAGVVALYAERSDGQWAMLGTLELGPFDTMLDTLLWVGKLLKEEGLVRSV